MTSLPCQPTRIQVIAKEFETRRIILSDPDVPNPSRQRAKEAEETIVRSPVHSRNASIISDDEEEQKLQSGSGRRYSLLTPPASPVLTSRKRSGSGQGHEKEKALVVDVVDKVEKNTNNIRLRYDGDMQKVLPGCNGDTPLEDLQVQLSTLKIEVEGLKARLHDSYGEVKSITTKLDDMKELYEKAILQNTTEKDILKDQVNRLTELLSAEKTARKELQEELDKRVARERELDEEVERRLGREKKLMEWIEGLMDREPTNARHSNAESSVDKNRLVKSRSKQIAGSTKETAKRRLKF